MKKFEGHFFFKLTDSKNLVGEFYNKTLSQNYTESADRIDLATNEDAFVGNYLTTWQERGRNGEPVSVLSKLHITPNRDSDGNSIFNSYELKWGVQCKEGVSFEGVGMVCDGILIGNYRLC